MKGKVPVSILRQKAFFYSTAALVTMYLAIRIYFAMLTTREAGPIIDTEVFVMMSGKPLFSAALWAGQRPPVVPLMYKMLNADFTAVILVQTAVSVVCWCFLAWTAALWIRNRVVKACTVILVALVGTSEPVVVWESCLISESISVSLLAAVIGAWLLFLRRSSWRRLIVILCLSLPWLFCRETNSWMMLLVALICLPVALFRKEKKYLVLFAGLFTLFLLSDISSTIGKRWVFPFLNVVSQRILPDPARVAYFARQGMPVSPALLATANTCASCGNYAYYNNPELESFRQWLYRKGKRSYMRWMLAHPATTLREPLSNIEYMVAPGSLFVYGSPSGQRLLPSFASKLLFPIGYQRYLSLFITWFLVLCTGIAIGSGVWRNDRAWLVAIILVLLSYPHLLIVWHGDVVGMEIGRHSLAVRVQLNLALWIMACLFIDRLIPLVEAGKKIPLLALKRGGR